MSEQFPGLTIAYVGDNDAHRGFRAALGNAKALAFVLADKDANVLRSFLAQADEIKRKSPDGNFAFGRVGGRSTTKTAQLAIRLTGNEIGLIGTELGGFVSQGLGLVYREVHRVFETYLVDLFEEIATRDKRVLFSKQKITHEEILRAGDPAEIHRLIIEERKCELTRSGFDGFRKTFEGIGLPILPTSEPPSREKCDDVQRRLILMGAIRNVIEHNRSAVNREFVDLVPNSPYVVGDKIVITATELGDTLWAVEWTADGLNRRAVEKFGIGGSN